MAKKSGLKKLKRPAKLGFLCYNGDFQGCGTIRVIYPYFFLNHYREKNNLMCHSCYTQNYVNDIEWYKIFTFVTFQRSATENHLKLIQMFKETVQKQFPIPVVYEIDDMLFDIPDWNYASVWYNKNAETVKNIMRSCDGIITSTAKLKEVYSPYCKKVAVIPNHLPKFVWGDIYPAHQYKDEKEKVKILWSGSQNHFVNKKMMGNDVQGGDFGEEFIKFIKKTTDKYEWHLLGAMPDELLDVKDKIRFHPWVNVFEYPNAVKDIEPDICIAPLQDLEFNHGKSNIKALEYTALGCPAVYSDVTPYKFMSLKAKNDEQFIAYVEKLADDIDYRGSIFNKDYRRVKGQLFWEENNNVRKFVNTYLGLFGQCL